MLVNHSQKTIDQITDLNGNPLYGERIMFERIMRDCDNSPLTWHVFYNLLIDYPINGKPRFEIDFLLACKKGAIVIEVKGGKIEKQGSEYINHAYGKSRVISDPFKQAEDYKWGLFNNNIISQDELVIATACAFPMSVFSDTEHSGRVWTKTEHDNTSLSFADFCIQIIDAERLRCGLSLPRLSDKDLERLINHRLTSSVFTSGDYSWKELEEVLEWLRADDESTIESLSDNNRLFIEGGPGTGKTTIAKTYIKSHKRLHGLYLCWNNLLAAKFKHKVEFENLGDCDVYTFAAFILKISNGRFNLEKINSLDGAEALKDELRNLLSSYRKDSANAPYDYVIADEVHDVLDKGIEVLLNEISSIIGDGLQTGRYLAFYDREQAYNNQARELSDYAATLYKNAARYRLLDCRRVQTNKDIITFARKIKDSENYDASLRVFKEIEMTDGIPITITHFGNAMGMIQHIKELAEDVSKRRAGSDYVLLTHSNIKNVMVFGEMPLLNGIRQFAGPRPLIKENINDDFSTVLPTANILEYKGLESRHVILALYCESFFNTFELYIGMSRAIQSLSLLILDNNV